jgi:predicted ribosomally synthesized peptide with nif11-like leader
MSIQSAKAYLARFRADEGFAKRVIAADGAHARERIAQSEGFTFTKGEIDSVASELLDEELAEVTCGPSGSMCTCEVLR